MRVLISGGGTGGHVYPALAVAAELGRTAEVPHQPVAAANGRADEAVPQPLAGEIGSHALPEGPADLLWIGGAGGVERELVSRTGIAYREIDTGQLRGINWLRAVANVGRMTTGMRQSRAIVHSYSPDVCLATGGYVCAPVIVACRLQGVPVLIYLPDMVPGWSIQHLSRFAARVAVSFPAAAVWFGGEVPAGKAVVTGYPVRRALVEAAADRETSRRKLAESMGWSLGSSGDLPMLLIWGGSQGSRSINQATWSILAAIAEHAQVVHVIGERDWPLYQNQVAMEPLPSPMSDRYHPVPYLHETMPLALAAADLTVARAGASSLGEFPVAGLPSILVPLPYGGVNQMRNAEQLASRGAAVIVDDDLLGEQLEPTVIGLLTDQERRARMAAAAKDLARPDAAINIVRQLTMLAQ